MHLHEHGAEGDDLSGPCGLVGHTDQIDDDALAVLGRRGDRAGDRAVTGDAEHGDQIRSGREGDVSFQLAGIHGLEIGEDGLVGVGGLDRRDRREALALDQRGAELEDVDVGGGLRGEVEGGLGGQGVHGELQSHVRVSLSRGGVDDGTGKKGHSRLA